MDDATEALAGWPTGRLLSTAARLVEHAWVESLAEIGLTHAGLVVLHLLDQEPATPSSLARAARVEAQTMSRTIERLERQGFVRRTVDATDRRRRLVARTPSGAAAFHRSRDTEAELFPPSSDEAALRASLLSLIRSAGHGRWDGPDDTVGA